MDLRIVLIPALLVSLALAAAVQARSAWRLHAQVRRSRNWPAVPGRVILSAVRETTVRVRRSTSIRRMRTAVRYAPHVVYEYEVDGTRYANDRVRIGPALLSSEPADAAREAAKHPVGQEVQVAYNPDLPSEAVLDPGLGPESLILWGVFLILVILMTALTAVLLSLPPITL